MGLPISVVVLFDNRLARRPVEVAAADYMQMKMFYRLTGIAACVDNRAKALFGDAKLIGDAGTDTQEITEQEIITF